MKLGRWLMIGLAVVGGLYLLLMVFVSVAPIRQAVPIANTVSPDGARHGHLSVVSGGDLEAPLVELAVWHHEAPDHRYLSHIGRATSNDFSVTWKTDRLLVVSVPPSFVISNHTPWLDDVEIHYVRRGDGERIQPAWRRDALGLRN